jgi:hypothetical protein
MLSLFGSKSNVVVEILLGLIGWVSGFTVLVAAAVMLTGKRKNARRIKAPSWPKRCRFNISKKTTLGLGCQGL